MPSYTWPEFPATKESNFEQKARTALNSWRSNAADMDIRIEDIEGFLENNSDFTPDPTRFRNSVHNALITDGVAKNINYYVDPDTGSDTNDGSSSAPFATLEKALESVPPGGHAVIYLNAGKTYTLTRPVILFNTTILVSKTGTDSVTITPQYYVSGDKAWCPCISLRNSCIRFEKVTFNIVTNTTGYSFSLHQNSIVRVGRNDCFGAVHFYYCDIDINDIDVRLVSGNNYGDGPSIIGVSHYAITINVNADGFLIDISKSTLAYSVSGGTINDNAGTGKTTYQSLVTGVVKDTDGKPRNVISNLIF